MAKIIDFRTPNNPTQSSRNQAVALARVSDEDQAKKDVSLPAQEQRIRKYAAEKGIEIARLESFDHSAYRGLDDEKQYNELIEYAVNNQVGFFLVDEKSRFARNRYTRVVNEEKLRRAGVKLVGVSEPDYDPRSIHGVWMDGISITKNEAYSVEIAYHVMKGMSANAAQRDPETGWCFKNGGIAPDGYKNKRVVRGKDKRGKDITKLLWDIDEERAPIIRHIVLDCWKDRGMSYSAIVDHLNSPNTVKFDGGCAPILSSRGRLWSKTTIREICMRALEGAYTGVYYWNRTGRDLRGTGQKWKDPSEWEVVENAHPAIITVEELEELRATKGKEVKQRKRNSIAGKRQVRTEDSPYLFSGDNLAGEPLFVCLNCGGAINSQQIGKYCYYLCATYKNKGKHACSKAVHIPKDYIEREVLKAIKGQFAGEHVKKIALEADRILKEDQRDQEEAVRYLEKTIKDSQQAADNLLDAIKGAGKSKALPILLEELEQVQSEIESLEKQMQEVEQEKPRMRNIDPGVILAKVQHLEELMTGATVANNEKKAAVRAFIRQLQFNPDTNELCIWFWPDPASPGGPKTRISIKTKQKKKGKPSFMITGGAGDRNRTGMVITDRRILSPLRLPIPPPRQYIH